MSEATRAALMDVFKRGYGDNEALHCEADEAIIEHLRSIDPELGDAMAEARDEQGWWYA